LTVGAAVPCYRMCGDPTVARLYPGLVDAASHIGGMRIRSRASLGGNLCNLSPSADSIPVLFALEATSVIAGPQGRRTVPVEEFCTGPRGNVLGEGELLLALQVPPSQPHSGVQVDVK
jgi:CO/xanthine dehydrogenase FAD-binding subunit